MIKKADILLAILLIVLGTVVSITAAMGSSEGAKVRILADGKEFGTYSLTENRIVTVEKNGHTNEIIIKDGKVSMLFSDCKNQVCVHTGAIRKTSQSIVCLPNKVMAEITGKGEQEYDAISN